MSIIAYKLLRRGKDGNLYPLFIDRKTQTPIGRWLQAECHPTKGFAVRQGWHCTLLPIAPHLKTELASGEKRVWCEVEVEDYIAYNRPESQGGTWVLAQRMRILRVLTDNALNEIVNPSHLTPEQEMLMAFNMP